jgi:hypothetical protein
LLNSVASHVSHENARVMQATDISFMSIKYKSQAVIRQILCTTILLFVHPELWVLALSLGKQGGMQEADRILICRTIWNTTGSSTLAHLFPHVTLRRFCSGRLRPGSTSAPVLLTLLHPADRGWGVETKSDTSKLSAGQVFPFILERRYRWQKTARFRGLFSALFPPQCKPSAWPLYPLFFRSSRQASRL